MSKILTKGLSNKEVDNWVNKCDVGILPICTSVDDMNSYFIWEHIGMLKATMNNLPIRPRKIVLQKKTTENREELRLRLSRICHHARHALAILEHVEVKDE